MLLERDKALRFLIDASYLKIFEQTNKKPPDQLNHPLHFCHDCFWSLCIHGHFQQQKTTDGSVPSGQQTASGTSVSNYLSVHTSPSGFRRGVHVPVLYFFFLTASYLLLYGWTVLSVSHSLFFHRYSVLWRGAQQSRLERTVWVLALCSLLATNTFWNVCFPLHSGFASLGHFSIIRMVMENSFCLLLVKLVYLEAAVHVFPSSGFSNRRFKVSYIVLHNKISCVAFLWFSLDFPWYHLLLCFGTSILAGKWSLLPIAPDVFIYIYFFEKGVLVLVWNLFVKSTTFLQMDLFDFLLSAVILLA